MLALILYIIGALCLIAAVVLLTFIPHRAVRITVLILFCLLFIGGMTFLLFKVSGQASLGNMFDALSGGQTQTAGGATDAGGVDTGTANTGGANTGGQQDGMTWDNIFDRSGQLFAAQNDAEKTLGDYLSAWGRYDGSTMTSLSDSYAKSGLQAELPFETDSPIQGFRIEGIADSGPEIKTADIVVTALNDAMQPVDIGYTVQLGYSDGTWYVISVVCDMPGAPTFDLFGTQPVGTPMPTHAGGNTAGGQEGILGLWYEQSYDNIYQLKFNADGTMVYFEYDDPYEGTYTFDAATSAGDAQFMGSSYTIRYDVNTGMLYLDDAPYTRTPQSGSADDTCSILRMWYEEEQGEFLLEFNPDGLVRYNADGEWYAGTYTFDEVSGTGTIDMFGVTYDIWYSFDSKSLFFDELFYSCIPPGPEVNRILGMWYAQGDGFDEIGQLEFYSDGTVHYYKLMTPEPGTYVFDDAAAHGDVTFGGYTYEIIYNADTNILSFEGVLYSRIPW